MNKVKIASAFNRAAASYDQDAFIQKIIGQYLIDEIKISNLSSNYIFDLGCGTGYFTQKLSHLFPDSLIFGVDFAEKMLEYASNHYAENNITYSVSDIESLPFEKDCSSIVFSNALFQWASNLPKMLCEIHRILMPKGKLFFSMFSNGTLKELHDVYQCIGKNNINYFIAEPNMKHFLKNAGFNNLTLQKKVFELKFDNIVSLMKYLKNLGANYVKNGNNGLTGKKLFPQLNKLYKQKYGDQDKIIASFEVLYGIAQRE